MRLWHSQEKSRADGFHWRTVFEQWPSETATKRRRRPWRRSSKVERLRSPAASAVRKQRVRVPLLRWAIPGTERSCVWYQSRPVKRDRSAVERAHTRRHHKTARVVQFPWRTGIAKQKVLSFFFRRARSPPCTTEFDASTNWKISRRWQLYTVFVHSDRRRLRGTRNSIQLCWKMLYYHHHHRRKHL